MTRTQKLQIALVSAGLLAWAWFGMGSWLLWGFILGAVFWIGLPLLGFCLLVGLCRLKRDGLASLRWAGWVAGSICVMLIAQILGEAVCGLEVEKARSFASVILPALDGYKAQTGRYPASLDELHLSRQAPRLFQYVRHESGDFGIYYTEPCSLLSGWRYNLAKQEWENVDWD